MNCRKSWNKIYHFTSNMLPHYLAKRLQQALLHNTAVMLNDVSQQHSENE